MSEAIFTGADSDPGGTDPVADSAGAAVMNANDRLGELQHDTFGQGSVIGDLISLPGLNEHSKHQGGDDFGYPS